MIFRVGIENHNDNRSIAWALEHPGCFAYGNDAAEAAAHMAEAADRYAGWVRAHGMSWAPDGPPQVQVDETFDDYFVPKESALASGAQAQVQIQIEAFFRYDSEALTGSDVERAFKLLDWSRQDLLDVIRGASRQQLEQPRPGERWSINGILNHVAGAEWWYQERIGSPFPEREEDLPQHPIERLELVRAHFTALLPKLAGVHSTVDKEGERWSPRKVLRRAAWHERDHTEHIRKLL